MISDFNIGLSQMCYDCVDIFSFGITLYELMCEQIVQPYGEHDRFKISEVVASGKLPAW